MINSRYIIIINSVPYHGTVTLLGAKLYVHLYNWLYPYSSLSVLRVSDLTLVYNL
jgi:hypothetical protein